ncbi:MAG TPA: RNA polymerase sigma factor [Solirubrobacteraceae bacterium]|jgi:RNA polymerase sigma-70 factor (ECF subfamily)|nr:RNA polymerase sigma factor [Solirubrobacteraceae bacterium]
MPRHPHIPTRRTPEDVVAYSFRVNPNVDRNDRDPAIVEAVKAAQTGDEEALRFLYLRYKDNIYGYVHSILRDEDEAQDVTQHVFLKLITVIHRYEPRSVPFTAWLIRVARNVALDHQRQRRAVPCEEVFESSEPTDDAEIDRRRGLESALSTLPDDQRSVVVLRHLVGLTPGEIADRMGRSEASIHGLHHRARLSLRRELEGVGCAPTTRLAA